MSMQSEPCLPDDWNERDRVDRWLFFTPFRDPTDGGDWTSFVVFGSMVLSVIVGLAVPFVRRFML